MNLILSEHAAHRWEARFPNINFYAVVPTAIRLTSRFARVFRQRHEDASGCLERRDYYYVYEAGIILVCHGKIVVTVLKTSREMHEFLNRCQLKKENSALRPQYKSKTCGIIKREKQARHDRRPPSNRDILNEYAF